MAGGEFRFFLSSDINLPVAFRIEYLHIEVLYRSLAESDNYTPNLYAECSLYMDGVQFGIPSRTSPNCEKPYKWNEMITLSAKYRDLTANAQLAFTVWDTSYPLHEVAVGGSTLKLFNSKKQLKTGKQKLRLWQGRTADGSVISTTSDKIPKNERGEVERLEKLGNKYTRGEIEHIDWLDKQALKAIERVKEEEESKRSQGKHIYLLVDLRTFMHPVAFQELAVQSPVSKNRFMTVYDPELGRENPYEKKKLKEARSVTRGVINRDRPTKEQLEKLQIILQYPRTRNLTGEERQLLWEFPLWLTTQKRALTKFLRCIDWSDSQESKLALEMMQTGEWKSIDIADALELLSPAFQSEEVRAHAVDVLEKTGDEELRWYLLQLVQAVRHERAENSRLVNFLVERAARNSSLANFFQWYLTVELSNPYNAKCFWAMLELFNERVSPELGDVLRNQIDIVDRLFSLAEDVKSVVRGGVQKKIEELRNACCANGLMEFKPIPLPLDPTIMVNGIDPQECSVFKSAQSPLRLSFRTVEGGKCRVIFKAGDDLRQDQLVIQLITLMDKLLKYENLDLQLTPYRVLATAPEAGMVEFIQSTSLAQVLSEHKSITKYFRKYHPDKDGPFGISSPCLETFIKSCAGYCVITYILGVGDRHLDNLLVQEDGRLFHVDFGFILGRDPKPFPPPMKLCKEMVEAMGGMNSQYFAKFKMYCCEAYNILRKSSNLILNLLVLMAGANLPDISSDPEKGALKLQEKFRLDLGDEAAVQFFQQMINESVSALFPQMVETIHRWSQYWR